MCIEPKKRWAVELFYYRFQLVCAVASYRFNMIIDIELLFRFLKQPSAKLYGVYSIERILDFINHVALVSSGLDQYFKIISPCIPLDSPVLEDYRCRRRAPFAPPYSYSPARPSVSHALIFVEAIAQKGVERDFFDYWLDFFQHCYLPCQSMSDILCGGWPHQFMMHRPRRVRSIVLRLAGLGILAGSSCPCRPMNNSNADFIPRSEA